MALKGLTEKGELVDVNAPGVLQQIDPDEAGSDLIIEARKKQWQRDNGKDKAHNEAILLAAQGVVVPERVVPFSSGPDLASSTAPAESNVASTSTVIKKAR